MCPRLDMWRRDSSYTDYASTRKDHHIGFQEHSVPGAGVLSQHQLHLRQQRGGQDQPPGCDLVSLDDKERLQRVRQVQFPLRDRVFFYRRLMPDGERPAQPLRHPGDFRRGEEAPS